MKRTAIALLLATGTALLTAATPSPPDLILTDAKIWTANPHQPVAEAVATQGERIIAIGRSAEILALAGPRTRVLSLKGKLVTPGFIDAAVQLIEGGMHLYQFHVGAAKNPVELRARVRDYAATLAPGRWIIATDWDDRNWPQKKQPTHETLDDITGDHPTVIVTLDGRLAVANALALRLAGIAKGLALPPDSGLYRDNKGEPTGLLIGSAIQLVERVIPPPCPEEVEDFVRAALRHAAENGLTGALDLTAATQYARTYRKLAEQGELTLRVTRQMTLKPRAGAAVPAFASGWDIAPLDPLRRIQAALTGRKMNVEDALRAYTYGGAWAVGEDTEKGTLEPGKLADFVVLSEDILNLPADRIAAAQVLRTIVGGHVVYDRSTGYQPNPAPSI